MEFLWMSSYGKKELHHNIKNIFSLHYMHIVPFVVDENDVFVIFTTMSSSGWVLMTQNNFTITSKIFSFTLYVLWTCSFPRKSHFSDFYDEEFFWMSSYHISQIKNFTPHIFYYYNIRFWIDPGNLKTNRTLSISPWSIFPPRLVERYPNLTQTVDPITPTIAQTML